MAEPTYAGQPNQPLVRQPQLMPAPAPTSAENEGEAGVNFLAIAWNGRWLILLSVIIGGASSWVYLQQVVPRYTSTARIYVEQNIPKLLSADAALGGLSSKLNTQAELIRSTSVVAAAAETPEVSALQSMRESGNPVGKIRQALRVGVGQDDIINISIELPDPDEAAVIVNAVVDAYITKYAERRRTNVVDVLTILRNEKEKRDAELEERRTALKDFRKEHVALAVQTSGEGNAVTELFSVLSSELNASRIALLESKARYDQAKRMLDSPAQLPFLRELARSESARQGSDLDTQIQQVEQRLIVARASWGEGFPEIKLLKDSLARLKKRQAEQEQATLAAFVETLRQTYALALQRRDELQRAYDEQFELATEVSGQAAELALLNDAYERATRTSDILDDRIKEVNLSEDVGAMNVSILEVATAGYQTYPQRSKTLGTGLAFGAMFGFGLAWLRDFLDHRLRSIDEIASTLQLPIAGALPFSGSNSKRDGDRNVGGRMVALQPRSIFAEAVRTLRTSLHFGVAGPESKIFVVTSPAPGDGKSTTASNLAIAMAQADQKVLLIDADMRKPTQAEIFGIVSAQGLPDVLSAQCAPVEATVATDVPSLDLMASGKKPSNPMDLLTNGLFVEALRQLAEIYDKIVIDSPPVMPVADSRLISAIGDCTLLVLRAERSTRRLSVAARDELLKVQTQRLGIVVNAAPAARSGYGYGYGGYGYGYGNYGQVAYGYGDEDTDAPPAQSSLTANGNGHAGRRAEIAGAAND